MRNQILQPLRPPVENVSALKSLLLEKDRQIMALVGKLDNIRRTAERGLSWAHYSSDLRGEEYHTTVDLFQHILDEGGRKDAP